MSTLEGISFTQRWFKAHTTFSSIVDETTLFGGIEDVTENWPILSGILMMS
jgi:hypothetical protein